MIDSLLEHLDTARARRSWEQFGFEPGGYALVTLHRPALVDDPAKLAAVTDGLIALAGDAPGRLPGSPADARATSRRPATTASRDAGVLATEPLGYLDFLCLEADAASSSRTPAASRRRRRRSASAASRSVTRPSGA